MNNKTKEIAYSGMFLSLLIILGPLKIDIGIVPITLQTLGVYLCALLLKPKQAFVVASLYLFIGAIGLPVFSGYQGGIGVLMGPTGGFIMSFPFVSLLISAIKDKKGDILTDVIGLIIGTIICYVMGTSWFMVMTEMDIISSLSLCVTPFLLGDVIKMIISIIISSKVDRKKV